MAVIYCDMCGNYVDDDWHPCEEHPETGELICPSCFEDLEEEEEDNPWELPNPKGECDYCHKPLVAHEGERGFIGNYHADCHNELRWEMQSDAGEL